MGCVLSKVQLVGHLQLAKGSSLNTCGSFSLLNNIGLGRSSWLKSIPHHYELFYSVIGTLVLPPIKIKDLLKS